MLGLVSISFAALSGLLSGLGKYGEIIVFTCALPREDPRHYEIWFTFQQEPHGHACIPAKLKWPTTGCALICSI